LSPVPTQPSTSYPVEGEVGRFTIAGHEVADGNGGTLRTRDLFPKLQGRQLYCTAGFKELALLLGVTDASFRKETTKLNRLRRQQEGGIAPTTLRDISEREGAKVVACWVATAGDILEEHGFSQDVGSCDTSSRADAEAPSVAPTLIAGEHLNEAMATAKIPEDLLTSAQANPIPYDRPEDVVEIGVDAVLAKKQKEDRARSTGDSSAAQEEPRKATLCAANSDQEQSPGASTAAVNQPAEQVHEDRRDGKKPRPRVSNKVATIRQDGQSYTMVAATYAVVLTFVLAFLLRNGLRDRAICFFVDGERCLKNAIMARFKWLSSVRVILDWHHLDKKCGEVLSSAIKGRKLRNEHWEQLKRLLWYGAVPKAIAYLEAIDITQIKDQRALQSLVGYLKKHQDEIPCYAVRKQLGLRNSSNLVEKANDLSVSSRQKHNGMSWSSEGSLGLAAITTIRMNHHEETWLDHGCMPLQFAKAA